MSSHALSSSDLRTASRSDVGRVRSQNEDSCREFSNEAGWRLLVTADGMGGHTAGAEASRLAVQVIGETFAEPSSDPAEMLRTAITRANATIHRTASDDPELRGMGTTAVSLLFAPSLEAWVAHVGDSRAYRHRQGRLEPLTQDHSVVAELQRRGLISAEEAEIHPRRNEILRSVGVAPEVEVDVTSVEVEPGDVFLLCSDGLSGLVSDPEIAAVLETWPPDEAAQRLIDMANERGGNDNVTVQIAQIPPPPELGATPRSGSTSATSEPAGEGGNRTEASTAFEPVLTTAIRTARRRRRAAVVSAVLLSGLAALVLLWRIYLVNTLPLEFDAAEAGVSPAASSGGAQTNGSGAPGSGPGRR